MSLNKFFDSDLGSEIGLKIGCDELKVAGLTTFDGGVAIVAPGTLNVDGTTLNCEQPPGSVKGWTLQLNNGGKLVIEKPETQSTSTEAEANFGWYETKNSTGEEIDLSGSPFGYNQGTIGLKEIPLNFEMVRILPAENRGEFYEIIPGSNPSTPPKLKMEGSSTYQMKFHLLVGITGDHDVNLFAGLIVNGNENVSLAMCQKSVSPDPSDTNKRVYYELSGSCLAPLLKNDILEIGMCRQLIGVDEPTSLTLLEYTIDIVPFFTPVF